MGIYDYSSGLEIYMYIFMELIAYFLGTLVLVLFYVAYNLYTKNAKYETWIVDRRNDTRDLQDKIHELDSMQMFEKDDEVGALFDEVNAVVEEYNRKVLDE